MGQPALSLMRAPFCMIPGTCGFGAESPGTSGIEFALGPAGGSPGGPLNALETTEIRQAPEEPPFAETAEPEANLEILIDDPLPKAVPMPSTGVGAIALLSIERELETAGIDGNAGSQYSAAAGASETDETSGGRPGVEDVYVAIVLARFGHYKECPRQPQQHRQEGHVPLCIVTDLQSPALEPRTKDSSEFAWLDQAALEMLKCITLPPAISGDMSQE